MPDTIRGCPPAGKASSDPGPESVRMTGGAYDTVTVVETFELVPPIETCTALFFPDPGPVKHVSSESLLTVQLEATKLVGDVNPLMGLP